MLSPVRLVYGGVRPASQVAQGRKRPESACEFTFREREGVVKALRQPDVKNLRTRWSRGDRPCGMRQCLRSRLEQGKQQVVTA